MRTGTTAFATSDFDSNLQDTCGTYLESRGVWYSLQSQERHVVRLEYQLYSKANGDSKLAIFQGSCANGNRICKDNVAGFAMPSYTNEDNGVAIFEFLTEKGESYLFLLSGDLAGTVGEYEFRVSEHAIPENDSCEGSIEVSTFPSILKGSLLGATPDFDESTIDTCGNNFYTRGLWYGLVGRGKVVRLEYQLFSVANGNSKLAIFEGPCSISDAVCLESVEGNAGPYYSPQYNDLVVYEFLAKESTRYLFLLSGETFNTVGDYEFKISEYPTPVNDNCKEAIAVESLPQKYIGSTLGATPDFDESSFITSTCGINWYTRGLWYRLVGSGTILRIEYQLNSVSSGDSDLSIFTGSCSGLDCEVNIKGADGPYYSSSYNDLVVHEMLAEEDKSYLMLLSGESFTAAGDFSLKLTEYDTPINDKCKDATSIAAFPFVAQESTFGATPDFNIFNEMCGATSSGRGVWYSFVGNNKLTTVSFSMPSISWGSSAQLSLFSGTCNILICEEDFGSSNLFEFVPKIGIEYRILLSGDSFSTVGDYEFKMAQYDSPTNDSCDKSIVMTEFPFSHNGDLKGATPDFNDGSVTCGNDYSGIWYSFAGTGKAYGFEMKTIGTDDYFYGEISLFQGSCDGLVCITSKWGSGANAIVSIDTVTTAGLQYLVLLAADVVSYDTIPFKLSVAEIA